MSVIEFPVLYIPDPDKGRPLFNGQVFVGEPDLDPQIPANQKQLSVIEEDGTVVPVDQPFLLSAGGVPVYNGNPVRLDVAGNYSIKILSKLGAQVYYVDNSLDGSLITTEQVTLSSAQTTVNLTSVSTLTGIFYIKGQDVDEGLLYPTIDYEITSDSVIELVRSYPAGSFIAAYGGTNIPTGDVNSVHGRTGVVSSENGDYTSSQVTNVPAGNITATEQQGVNDELDGFISSNTSNISNNTADITNLKKRTGISGVSTTPVGFDYFATANATVTMDDVTGFIGGERFSIVAAKGVIGSTLTVDGSNGELVEPASGGATDTVFNLTTVGVNFEFIFNVVTGNWEV